MTSKRTILFAVLLGAGLPAAVIAGPPFLTDDPQPVDYKRHEAYLFATLDRTAGGKTVQAPAAEYNIGAAPGLQLHLVAPFAYAGPRRAAGRYGFGDVELGAKYRFLEESAGLPQAGIFPMAELATGDAARGLGNGKTWYKLPLWLQKSWGPWTTYGGGGYALNRAAGMRDYGFAGWLLQRGFGERLVLGGEIFAQQADADGARGFALLNFGGYYDFTPGTSLLFSAGHTYTGERHAIAYLALYRTW